MSPFWPVPVCIRCQARFGSRVAALAAFSFPAGVVTWWFERTATT
ncbi:hypothetical protein ACTVZO_43040 [Streptomyces sp. IBSNAI002]